MILVHPLVTLLTLRDQDLKDLSIGCEVNGNAQDVNSQQMLFSITQIISFLSSIWILKLEIYYIQEPRVEWGASAW